MNLILQMDVSLSCVPIRGDISRIYFKKNTLNTERIETNGS